MIRPSDVDHFTPLFESVIDAVGVIGAAVHGRVWRYCQGKHKCCQAAMETIGRELHLSRHTVLRYLTLLCQKGFLVDHTPTLRNHPHTFTVAEINTEDTTTVAESNTTDTPLLQSATPAVAESNSHCSRKSQEESRQDKREKITPDGDFPLDSEWPADSNLSPRDDLPERPPKQTDPIMAMLDHKKRRGDGRSWTVTGPEGANPWADGPILSFCTLTHMPNAPPGQVESWAREFERIAGRWKASPAQFMMAVRMISKDKAHDWRSFTSPFNPSFEGVVDVMLSRVMSGQTTNLVIRND